ncbi:hypothetical protein [Mucilaginibacter pedocola]|uniref:Coproporphyrinogen III oxidase n=1 Tax=Mucilaginibacter pedocola TaxID=1792845 RepID=A0A1S9PFI2_9SPHI|nr:hypothetical protein [Mucilaginibacter pedocola]OOQ59669.1 hypothetical protein BC343_05760 [Mucilaginibacter pedocola]
MKNLIKLSLVAFTVSATIIACDPAKPAESSEADTLKTVPDTTKADTIITKADTLKSDTVKK